MCNYSTFGQNCWIQDVQMSMDQLVGLFTGSELFVVTSTSTPQSYSIS